MPPANSFSQCLIGRAIKNPAVLAKNSGVIFNSIAFRTCQVQVLRVASNGATCSAADPRAMPTEHAGPARPATKELSQNVRFVLFRDFVLGDSCFACVNLLS